MIRTLLQRERSARMTFRAPRNPLSRSRPRLVTPKTVRPRRQLYISGLRYCSPTLGRWISRDPIGEKGGVALYEALGNNPLNCIDVLGLYNPLRGSDGLNYPADFMWDNVIGHQSQQSEAGPDITAALDKTLRQIEEKWAEPIDDCTRQLACKTLYSMDWLGFLYFGKEFALTAWDIQDLHDANDLQPGSLGYDSVRRREARGTGEWAQTVQLTFRLSTRVYFAGDVNYVMWGRINALCNKRFPNEYSLEKAVQAARDYRGALWGEKWADGAEAFTRYGYNGTSPERVALEPDSRHTANPLSTTDRTVFTYIWVHIRGSRH